MTTRWMTCTLAAGLLLVAARGEPAGAQDRRAVAVEVLMVHAHLHPRDARAWYDLARAYESVGQRLLAMRSYRRALRADPRDARALRRLEALERASTAFGQRFATR